MEFSHLIQRKKQENWFGQLIVFHFAKRREKLHPFLGKTFKKWFRVNLTQVAQVACWHIMLRRCLIQQTDAMSSIFDWEVRRLGMRDALKHGTKTVSGFGYFHKNCSFLWGKNVSKTKDYIGYEPILAPKSFYQIFGK